MNTFIDKIIERKKILFAFSGIIFLIIFYLPAIELPFYYADDRSAFIPWLNSELWSFVIFFERLSPIFEGKFSEIYGTQKTLRFFGQASQLVFNFISLKFQIEPRILAYILNIIVSIPLILFFSRISKISWIVFILCVVYLFTTPAYLIQNYWLINVAYAPLVFFIGLTLLINQFYYEYQRISRRLYIFLFLTLHCCALLTSELALSLPFLLIFAARVLYQISYRNLFVGHFSMFFANIVYVLFYVYIRITDLSESELSVYYESARSTNDVILYLIKLSFSYFHLILPLSGFDSWILLFLYSILSIFFIVHVLGVNKEQHYLLPGIILFCSLPLIFVHASRLFYIYNLILPILFAAYGVSSNRKIIIIFTLLCTINFLGSFHWYKVYKNDIPFEDVSIYNRIIPSYKKFIAKTDIKDDNFTDTSIEMVYINDKVCTTQFPIQISRIKSMNLKILNYDEFVLFFQNVTSSKKMMDTGIFPFGGWIALKKNLISNDLVVIGGTNKSSRDHFDPFSIFESVSSFDAYPIFLCKKLD
jgi:hypothetical protein